VIEDMVKLAATSRNFFVLSFLSRVGAG